MNHVARQIPEIWTPVRLDGFIRPLDIGFASASVTSRKKVFTLRSVSARDSQPGFSTTSSRVSFWTYGSTNQGPIPIDPRLG